VPVKSPVPLSPAFPAIQPPTIEPLEEDIPPLSPPVAVVEPERDYLAELQSVREGNTLQSQPDERI